MITPSLHHCLWSSHAHINLPDGPPGISAAAASHFGSAVTVDWVKADFETAPISAKLKALLRLAGKVQQDGKLVTASAVEAARREGATDLEVHDTVLIAAASCMYSRSVDGRGTWQPTDPRDVRADGQAPRQARLPHILHPPANPRTRLDDNCGSL